MGWEELTDRYPVIVVEGCDGTGKSTLATLLGSEFGYRVVRSGRLDDGADLADRYRAALYQPGHLVLDRSFVTELVYGPLRTGASRLSADEAARLAFALADRGGAFVYLTAHPKAIAWRLRARDGHAPPLDWIRAVMRSYRNVFAGLDGAAPIVKIDTTADIIKLLASAITSAFRQTTKRADRNPDTRSLSVSPGNPTLVCMSRRSLIFGTAAAGFALVTAVTATTSLASITTSTVKASTTSTSPGHLTVRCDPDESKVRVQCPDVYNPIQAFGYYVGHDEPGVWAYSHLPGAGNNARWQLTLPRDPPPNPTPGAANYAFENHIAFWFGMALCASQSFPEQTSTCVPDSDSNIVDPKTSAQHAGSAYLELQFYPPGAALFPSGISCDPTRWCAAMNVWSYYLNPVTGQPLNTACSNLLGGIELDNYAFVQRDGIPTGPPDPLHSTAGTFTPNAQTLMMHQGDHVGVTIHDTADGLTVDLTDHSDGQAGTMTASAANGFAQMNFAPDPSVQCTSTPYTYHPMYSTSGPQTRATWTAYPYNVAYADETGHFSYCSQVDETSGTCTGLEGPPGAQHPADSDDAICFGADQQSRDRIGGCVATNDGFDGTPYLDDWPNGQASRGTPVQFTSPLTGPSYQQNYDQLALAGSQPFVEFGGGQQGCDIFKMSGCTLLPRTDAGTQAEFYPFFYTTNLRGCGWAEGTDNPLLTVNDFGKQAEYGTYNTGVWYTGTNGTPFTYSSNFLHVFPANPCPATPAPATPGP